ncbi:hypothetical protein [Mangrovactinospora gilvigrisea]|uniref:hypothetical protein n=1 Tax=Mangrovactinospora gilvigrisea TaxID=1428644 RepID=UPI001114821B|nr:hypothetical protein [Mangrovactinospora gilvigrisea]
MNDSGATLRRYKHLVERILLKVRWQFAAVIATSASAIAGAYMAGDRALAAGLATATAVGVRIAVRRPRMPDVEKLRRYSSDVRKVPWSYAQRYLVKHFPKHGNIVDILQKAAEANGLFIATAESEAGAGRRVKCYVLAFMEDRDLMCFPVRIPNSVYPWNALRVDSRVFGDAILPYAKLRANIRR